MVMGEKIRGMIDVVSNTKLNALETLFTGLGIGAVLFILFIAINYKKIFNGKNLNGGRE